MSTISPTTDRMIWIFADILGSVLRPSWFGEIKNVWKSDKSWEPDKIWKFEKKIKFEKIWKFEILKFKIAQVDPRDMLNNFCFHVYGQKSLFIGENCNDFFWTS